MKWMLVAALMGLTACGPQSQEKYAEREKIAACVKARDDTLNDLSTRRVMRDACIQMDQEFQKKWGVSSREL